VVQPSGVASPRTGVSPGVGSGGQRVQQLAGCAAAMIAARGYAQTQLQQVIQGWQLTGEVQRGTQQVQQRRPTHLSLMISA
jgi:hypothetical protein